MSKNTNERMKKLMKYFFKKLAPFAIIMCSFIGQSQDQDQDRISGSDWMEVEVLENVYVKFPNSPEQTIENGSIVYNATDDNAIYITSVRTIPTTVTTDEERDQIYDGLAGGMIDTANGQLLSSERILIDGITFRQIKYTATGNTQLPDVRYSLMVILGDQLINIGYWTTVELDDLAAANRKQYFNSVRIASQQKELLKLENTIYDLGVWTELICFILVGIFLLGGTVLIIRYVRKKK
jgi:hypothetical protein